MVRKQKEESHGMNDASVTERSPHSQDVLKAAWHMNTTRDRTLNENGYPITIVQFTITTSDGDINFKSEMFQQGDMRVIPVANIYEHIVFLHNDATQPKPRNVNQARGEGGKFVSKKPKKP